MCILWPKDNICCEQHRGNGRVVDHNSLQMENADDVSLSCQCLQMLYGINNNMWPFETLQDHHLTCKLAENSSSRDLKLNLAYNVKLLRVSVRHQYHDSMSQAYSILDFDNIQCMRRKLAVKGPSVLYCSLEDSFYGLYILTLMVLKSAYITKGTFICFSKSENSNISSLPSCGRTTF